MFTHKKHLYRILTILVLLGTFHLAMTTGIPTVFADPPVDPAIGMNQAHQSFMEILSMITTFMQILLLIILNLLGYLLQGDFFNDSNMMNSLNQIWILSRNIMNVIFAILLIGVAFYTIITAKSEMIKSKWSQFVLAVVFVNFSWFFPRVIIDVANVVTATVYSIPNMLPDKTCMTFGDKPGDPLKKCRIITDMKILPGNPFAQETWKNACRAKPGLNPDCESCNALACIRKEDYPGINIGAAHAMINGMAVSFIHIDALTQIPPDVFGLPAAAGGAMANFETTLKIMINIMMVFIVQVGVVLPLIGLGVGLFIRILILWVTIAFMPFTFLGLVINGKLGTNIFGFETDIWKEFINAAFLPAVVGIPFVIGFIMLKTVAKIPSPAGFPQDWGIPMINGVGSWWAFLWMMAAVAIIYTGAFAALRRSAITGKITDRIKAFGDSTFGAVAQLPLLTPLPLPAGSKSEIKNLGGLLHAPGKIGQQIRLRARGDDPNAEPVRVAGADRAQVNESNVKAKENTDNIIRAINGLSLAGIGTKEFTANLNLLQSRVGGDNLGTAEMLSKFRDIVKTKPDVPDELKRKLADIEAIVAKAGGRPT